MGLYEPKSCCICFDTKNGSLILGSLSLILTVIGLILNADWDHNMLYSWIPLLLSGVCSSLLIHGIRTDDPGLMVPYLILQRVAIILLILATLAAFGFGIYLADRYVFMIHLPSILPCILTLIGIQIYCHLVVYAYHKQLKRALSEEHHKLQEERINDGDEKMMKV